MPTSVPGSPETTSHPQRGFTLLELLVVVSLVALATAGVGLALPDPAATQLEREAQRVTALLEAGRAQARSTGVAVIWQTTPQGFALDGQHRAWLTPGTQAWATGPTPTTARNSGNTTRMVLGPEPLMAAQTLQLRLGERSVWLGTDGLRPFALRADTPAQAQP